MQTAGRQIGYPQSLFCKRVDDQARCDNQIQVASAPIRALVTVKNRHPGSDDNFGSSVGSHFLLSIATRTLTAFARTNSNHYLNGNMKPINATCQACDSNFTAEPKRTFLGFQRLQCPSCSAKVVYPLTKGYRVTYWVLLIFMIFAIIGAFAQGGIGLPGGLGVAVLIALVRDWIIKRRVTKIALNKAMTV